MWKEHAGSDTTRHARRPAEAALWAQAFRELQGASSLLTATGDPTGDRQVQEGCREGRSAVRTPQGACVLGRWQETDLDVLLLRTLLWLLLCPSGESPHSLAWWQGPFVTRSLL